MTYKREQIRRNQDETEQINREASAKATERRMAEWKAVQTPKPEIPVLPENPLGTGLHREKMQTIKCLQEYFTEYKPEAKGVTAKQFYDYVWDFGLVDDGTAIATANIKAQDMMLKKTLGQPGADGMFLRETLEYLLKTMAHYDAVAAERQAIRLKWNQEQAREALAETFNLQLNNLIGQSQQSMNNLCKSHGVEPIDLMAS